MNLAHGNLSARREERSHAQVRGKLCVLVGVRLGLCKCRKGPADALGAKVGARGSRHNTQALGS
ncbi:unnamed protein product [Sphagnum compactum]